MFINQLLQTGEMSFKISDIGPNPTQCIPGPNNFPPLLYSELVSVAKSTQLPMWLVHLAKTAVC